MGRSERQLEAAAERLAAVMQEGGGPNIQERLKRRYGRGWQRKLAQVLGIAESTLSGWLADDEMPPWARLVLGLVLQRSKAEVTPSSFDVIKRNDGRGYMVVSTEGDPGDVIAECVPDLRWARRIALYPALEHHFHESSWVIRSGYGPEDAVFGEQAKALEAFADLLTQIDRGNEELPEDAE